MSTLGDTTVRQRNRRGEGQRLRADIVGAATALLEESGGDEAVTLRAVARRVGIAAPSIYPHFADRETMLVAVKEQIFRTLILVLEDAAPLGLDPVGELRAGCAAYLRFASEHPALYQVVFGDSGLSDMDCSWPPGHGPDAPAAHVGAPAGAPDAHVGAGAGAPDAHVGAGAGAPDAASDPVLATGVAAFDVLVTGIQRCADAGRSTSTDPFADAAALWVALHGMATLTATTPSFPWPDLERLLTNLVDRLACLVP